VQSRFIFPVKVAPGQSALIFEPDESGEFPRRLNVVSPEVVSIHGSGLEEEDYGKAFPRGLKAGFFGRIGGTAEAVPFYRTLLTGFFIKLALSKQPRNEKQRVETSQLKPRCSLRLLCGGENSRLPLKTVSVECDSASGADC
jgi:hypothetical protein